MGGNGNKGKLSNTLISIKYFSDKFLTTFTFQLPTYLLSIFPKAVSWGQDNKEWKEAGKANHVDL